MLKTVPIEIPCLIYLLCPVIVLLSFTVDAQVVL